MRTTSRSAVRRAYVPARLLSAQHSLRVARRDDVRSGPPGSRVGAKAAASVAPATPEQLPFVQGFLVVLTTRSCDSAGGTRSSPSRSLLTDSLFTRAIWHFARGSAFAATGQADRAVQERQALETIATDPALAKMPAFSLNPPDKLSRSPSKC